MRVRVGKPEQENPALCHVHLQVHRLHLPRPGTSGQQLSYPIPKTLLEKLAPLHFMEYTPLSCVPDHTQSSSKRRAGPTATQDHSVVFHSSLSEEASPSCGVRAAGRGRNAVSFKLHNTEYGKNMCIGIFFQYQQFFQCLKQFLA